MTVLDASAVLALVHDEPGADLVAEELAGGALSTVNLAEVIGKFVDAEVDARPVVDLLASSGVVLLPLDARDAELAGALRGIPGGRQLSLGDRCCLAVTLRHDSAEVLTADRAWAELDLPLRVRLLR